MKQLTFLILLLTSPILLTAQEHEPWEQLLGELMSLEDGEEEAWEDVYEQLAELAQHPIDLNTATPEKLAELPFLNERQIEDIEAYLYLHGPMKSMSELRMVTSLDYMQLQLLPYFVRIAEESTEQKFPTLERLTRYGRHELIGYGRIPCYERKGDQNGYTGYPYKHWLRYTFHYGDYAKAGLVGTQDAGEPFFSGRNSTGYDAYSYYVQLRHLGRIETAVAGKYRLSAGMGLVLNSGFSMGKLVTLSQLNRQNNTLKAHSSRSSSGYFQGAAATVRLSRQLTATAFASYRALDATLAKDGTATTLLTNGYHRTPAEMEKKNNTHATDAGLLLQGRWGRLHAGATAVYTHLDRRLQPNTATLYRRHYAQGTDFLNLSVSYGYASRRLTLNGETAMNRNGALATLNSLSLLLTDGLSLTAIQRFYSYRYTALYARSLSEGSQVQNESGVYVALDWQPSPCFRLQLLTDFSYAPWPRYQVSRSSQASDNLLHVTVSRGPWRLQGRYRLHLRQRDNEQKTALQDNIEQRARLSISYNGTSHLSLTTQADGTLVAQHGTQQRGWAVSQQAAYSYQWLRLNAGCIYFDTDNYDTRVYTYEQGPLYSFSFPTLYGRGLRYMLMARVNLGQRLMLTAKLGVTDRLDRAVTGTGLQQVDGSSLADIDLQARWKF